MPEIEHACGLARGFVRRVAAVLLYTFVASLAAAPGSIAWADCAPGTPCMTLALGSHGTVRYARMNWTPIAEARRFGSGGHDVRMIQGDASVVLNDTAARFLGLRGGQTSGVLHPAASNAPIVFARYAPGPNELRIDVIRIERSASGVVRVSQALFGPHHGDHWAAQLKYLSDDERRRGMGPGINPFARFADPGDDIFHRIGPDGMLVAVGHAMRHLGTSLGIIAVTNLRFQQREIDDGGLLTSKTTYIIDGYAKPDWWIAAPMQIQQRGNRDTAICVGSEPPESCFPHHLAKAGIAVLRWQGGNMPDVEDHLYHWEDTKSGFTVLGMGVLVGLLVFTGAYMIGGQLAGGSFVAGSDAIGASYAAGNAALIGGVSGASYVGISDLLHPGSVFDRQSQFLGNTIGRGELPPIVSASVHSNTLQESARVLQIQRAPRDGLAGVRESYSGTCEPTLPLASCRAKSREAGSVFRNDDYVEFSRPQR